LAKRLKGGETGLLHCSGYHEKPSTAERRVKSSLATKNINVCLIRLLFFTCRCLDSTAFTAIDVFQNSDKSRRVKHTFLVVVARQISNAFQQFNDFRSNQLFRVTNIEQCYFLLFSHRSQNSWNYVANVKWFTIFKSTH